MVDIEFLNQKATKLKSALKNIRAIVDKGEEVFLSTPMYPDRVKYYLIIAYDFLEEISCHILKEMGHKVEKGKCLEEISKIDIFSEKLNRTFGDFVWFRSKLFEEKFSYSEKELYHLTKDILSTIDSMFINELALLVKQLKQKAPKLKIPVNLVKINKNLSTMKGEVKRIHTFKSMSPQEFYNSQFAVDRTRYFLTVYIDAASWICRHIARQLKITAKNCFQALVEKGILSKETGESLHRIADKKEDLANPITPVDTGWLYNLIFELDKITDNFIKELSNSLLEKGDNQFQI